VTDFASQRNSKYDYVPHTPKIVISAACLEMVPPGPAAGTPPRRGVSGGGGGPGPFHPPPPYPYDYENVSPGTPYSSRGGAGSGGPPPLHSPYPPYYRGGGGPPPPHSDYWIGSSGADAPSTPSHHRGGGYWGPPPHSGPYHEGFRMGPPPMRGGMSPYPHHRSPMRRPFVSPGEPLSPHHPYDQQRKDFRPPAPAAAVRGSGKKPAEKEAEKKEADAAAADDDGSKDKNNGDPLSVLADVSAGMDGKDKKKDGDSIESPNTADGQDEDESNKKESESSNKESSTPRPPVPVPAPTSPLQRRAKPSPITPSQASYERKGGSGASVLISTPGRHQPITPSRSQDSASLAAGGSWGEAPSIPPGVSSEASYPPHEYPPHPQGPYTPVRSRGGRPPYGGDLPPPTDSPALVERGSFDSHGDASSYRGPPFPPATPPSRAFFYDDGPPPGYGSGNGGSYWEAAGPSPYSPSYHPPPRGGPGSWNPPPPPPPGSHGDPYYGMPHRPPPPDYPPPPHYGEEDPGMMGPGGPYGPPPPHYRGPPPPHHHHPGMHVPPYGYGYHPRMEEKTILRKKFSWKHYPEVSKVERRNPREGNYIDFSRSVSLTHLRLFHFSWNDSSFPIETST
jgi:hypothetical protein